MKDEMECILNAVSVAVVLNLVVPQLLKPYATKEEVNPPGGPANLPVKGQVMHMMVRHAELPILSSLSIGLMLAACIYLGYLINPMKYLK